MLASHLFSRPSNTTPNRVGVTRHRGAIYWCQARLFSNLGLWDFKDWLSALLQLWCVFYIRHYRCWCDLSLCFPNMVLVYVILILVLTRVRWWAARLVVIWGWCWSSGSQCYGQRTYGQLALWRLLWFVRELCAFADVWARDFDACGGWAIGAHADTCGSVV